MKLDKETMDDVVERCLERDGFYGEQLNGHFCCFPSFRGKPDCRYVKDETFKFGRKTYHLCSYNEVK